MLVLCINTGTIETNLCLVKDSKVLAQESWGDFAREAEMLIPSLNKMIDDARVKVSDLEGVFVISGPGSFSAIRVGVVTANTFSTNLGIPLFTINTFELMELMYKGYDQIALNGGGSTLIVKKDGEIETVRASEFKSDGLKIAADLTEKQLDLLDDEYEILKKSLNFEQVCARISSEEGFKEYELKELPLIPYYVKKPSIS